MGAKNISKYAALLLMLLAASDCSSRRYTAFNDFGTPNISETFETPTRITIGNESNFGPTLSPNGAYMFYTSDRTGNKDIFVKKTRGGYPSPLTTHPADDFSPVVSPDGQKLAFVSRRSNALGAIHIMDLRQTIKKVTGQIDGDTTIINISGMELRNPSWLPDSGSIVFTGRQPGTKQSQIYIAAVKGPQKPQPLTNAIGEHPYINKSGSQITYARQGRIYIFDLKTNTEIAMTAGQGIKDGHPKFGENDDEILFIRYADDTNNDTAVDGNDRPTIWSLSVSYQLSHQTDLENFHLLPLTSAKIPAFYPSSHQPYIYFSSQQEDTLDIYKLPSDGHTRPHLSLAETEVNFHVLDDDHDKTYVLRHDAAIAARRGDDDLSTQIALQELSWLIELGRVKEAEWLSNKIAASAQIGPDYKLAAAFLKMEVEILPWLFPQSDLEIGPSERLKFKDNARKISEMIQSNQRLSRNTKAIGRFVKAEISATLGELEEASDSLTNIARDYGDLPDIGAKSLDYRQKIEAARGLHEKSIATVKEMAGKFPGEKTKVRNACIDVTTRISMTDPRALQKLQQLVKSATNTPMLTMRTYYRIAQVLQNEDKQDGAINYYSRVIDTAIYDPELAFTAATEIMTLYETNGQYTSAESTLAALGTALNRDADHAKRIKQLGAEFHSRRGHSHIANGDVDLSVVEYRRALDIAPDNLSAREGLINAQLINMNVEGLKRDLENKIASNKNDSDSRYLLSYILVSQLASSNEAPNETRARAIELLQDARQANGQEPRYHALLAKLYTENSRNAAIRENPDTFSGRLQLAKTQIKGMFGFAEPNWLELAIDSYLTAYQMTPDESINKARLATDIADIYFANGNYHLSLRYYLKRIQAQSDALRQTPRDEMLLFRHTGRAAFFTDNLNIAETMQIRALREAEKTGRDLDIAYSLDALALTYRELKKFDAAIKLYDELAELNTKLRAEANLSGTLINIGYCYFMKADYERALTSYERAEQILLRLKDGKPDTNQDVIRVDLGGQNSAAFGFSTSDRLIQIASFRAKIFEATGKHHEAINSLEKKLSLLDAKVTRNKKMGLGEGYLAEERSITLNNLAWLQHNQGFYEDAARNFNRSRELATRLRMKNQAVPPRAEWLNLLNLARVEIQKQNTGTQTAIERTNIEKMLKQAIDALDPAIAENQKESMLAGAALKSVYAQITSSASDVSEDRTQIAQRQFQESILLAEKIGLASKSTANANLNLDHTAINVSTDQDSIFESQYDFRRTALMSPQIAWKYFATRGLYQQALSSLTTYVEAGGVLKNHEYTLLKRCIDNILETPGSSDQINFEAVRRYFFITIQAEANLSRSSLSAQTKPVTPLGKIERIAAVLEEDDALVTTYATQSGRIFGFKLNGGVISSIPQSTSAEQAVKDLLLPKRQDSAAKVDTIKRIYVSANTKDILTGFMGFKTTGLEVSFIASPDTLPKIHNARPIGIMPEIRPKSDLDRFLSGELNRRLIDGNLTPIIFTDVNTSTTNTLSVFLDKPIASAAHQLDEHSVLFAYLGPRQGLTDNATVDRARNSAVEAYERGDFGLAKQRAVEALIGATATKNVEMKYQAATIAVEASLKKGETTGVSRLKQIQADASKILGKTWSIDAALDSAALAVDQGHWKEAEGILSAVVQSFDQQKNAKSRARFLYLTAKNPNRSDRERLDDLKASLDIYQAHRDHLGIASAEELTAKILGKQRQDAATTIAHLQSAAVHYDKASHFQDLLRINLQISNIWIETGEPDKAIKILYPIATTKGLTQTNRNALDVLSALADAHCSKLTSRGCGWAFESLASLSRRVPDKLIALRAETLTTIIKSRRLADRRDASGAGNYLGEQILRVAGQSDEDEIKLRYELANVLRLKGEFAASDKELELSNGLIEKFTHRTLMDGDSHAIGMDMDMDMAMAMAIDIATGLALNALSRGDSASAVKITEDIRANSKFTLDGIQQITVSMIAAESHLLAGHRTEAMREAQIAQSALKVTWRPEAKWRVAALTALLKADVHERIKGLEEAITAARTTNPRAAFSLSSQHLADSDPRTLEGVYFAQIPKEFNVENVFKMFTASYGKNSQQILKSIKSRLQESQSLLMTAEFATGTAMIAVDQNTAAFAFTPHKASQTKLQLPDTIENLLTPTKELTILTDEQTRYVPFAAANVNGKPILNLMNVRFIQHLDDLSKTQQYPKGTRDIKVSGVIIPPTPESMTKKTAKILSRYFPESHLLEPKKLTEKSLLRELPGHELHILSLPKAGSQDAITPTSFKMPGTTTQSDPSKTMMTPRSVSGTKLNARLTLLPQPNRAIDLMTALRDSGSDAVLVNFGNGDQDIDTFLLKNFLKHYSAQDDACTALNNAQKNAIRYYPGNSAWANFRIYGQCVR